MFTSNSFKGSLVLVLVLVPLATTAFGALCTLGLVRGMLARFCGGVLAGFIRLAPG